MSIRDARREAVLDRLADHVLRDGLPGASLRALAAAAGTSDRMLLYYFADKDDLLAATLQRLAARLTGLLAAALPDTTPRGFEAVLADVRTALETDAVRPFLPLWLELSAAAARGREPHLAVAGAIADGFRAWATTLLDGPEDRRPALAARLLATVEGMVLLEAVGRPGLAEEALRAGG